MVKRYVNENGLVLENLDEPCNHDLVHYSDYTKLEANVKELEKLHADALENWTDEMEDNQRYKEVIERIRFAIVSGRTIAALDEIEALNKGGGGDS